MKSPALALLLALSATQAAATPAPAAATPLASAQADAGEEILVIARSTGIPVWSVDGPNGRLVLVSSLSPVPPGTKWEPGRLSGAVRKANRVLFLNGVQASLSPFQAVGWYLKFRNRATLPGKQRLSDMLAPADLARLEALQRRGVIKPGWERRNPLHLSIELRNRTQGKMKEVAAASGFVAAAAREHKIPVVPMRTVAAAPLAKRFFALPPSTFVPCLRTAITLAEAGPGTFKARADAWAERRVKDALASPGGGAEFVDCAPADIRQALMPDLRPTMRRLATERGNTVAVIDLKALAEPRGILDHLTAAGYQVRGPAWR